MSSGLDSITSVYSEARAEYSKQLCVFLVPAYFKFFIDLLEKSRRLMESEPKRVLWQFQNLMNEIHDWNMEKVSSEINNIYTNCGCDYLDDLITMVFIAHTKILTAIRLSSNNKKVEINVPRVEHFLFKALCETAKMLWSSTYLFRDGISGIEKQQNYRQIENIINEGILQAVRSLLPVKSIIKDYVKNEGVNDSDSESDTEEEIQSKSNDFVKSQKDENNDNDNKTLEKIKSTSLQTDIINQVTNNIIPMDIPTDIPANLVNNSISETEFDSNKQEKQELNIPLNIDINNNEIILPNKHKSPHTIIIDDKPTVRFGEFDAVFDSDNPLESDMIFEPKDGDDNSIPDLEILDEVGQPLGLEDFEDLDKKEKDSESLGINDYETI